MIKGTYHSKLDSLLLFQEAAADPRRRKGVGLHRAGLQAVVNAMLPATYVRPHRFNVAQVMAPLDGTLAFLTFEDGAVSPSDIRLMGPGDVAYLPAEGAQWHAWSVIGGPAVLLECLDGPYAGPGQPDGRKEYMPNTPEEGTPAGLELAALWERLSCEEFLAGRGSR